MVGVARCDVIDNCAVCPFFAVEFAADPPVFGNDVAYPLNRFKRLRSAVINSAGVFAAGINHVAEHQVLRLVDIVV